MLSIRPRLLLGYRERGLRLRALPFSRRLMFSLSFCPIVSASGSCLLFSVGKVSSLFFTEFSFVEKSGSSWIVTSLVSLVYWISF